MIGAIAGYLALWSVYWAFKLATGKEGMGYGDFKLLAAIGAWLGWKMLPAVILLSSLVGAVVGIVLIVLARHGRHVPIPFGPYLGGGGHDRAVLGRGDQPRLSAKLLKRWLRTSAPHGRLGDRASPAASAAARALRRSCSPSAAPHWSTPTRSRSR